MLDLIATKTTNNDTSSTSAVTDMPEGYASGDLLLALVAIGAGNTITATGWTAFGTASTLGGRRLHILTRVADGTEPASYTFTLSGATFAVCHVMAWRGQHGTTPVITQASADRVAFSSVTSTNSPTSQTTGAVTDCAIIHAMVNASGSASVPSVEDDSLTVTCNETATTSTRLVAGYTSQAAAGAIPQINWLNGASQSGLVATIAIAPATANGIPPKADTPLNAISKPGYSATTYGSLAGTITSLSGVNINLTGTDYPAGTIAATTTEAAALSVPDGVTLQLADYHQTSTATVTGGEWVGSIETLASPVSYDAKLLSLQFAAYQNASGGVGGKGGTGYIFADSSMNWAAFAVQDFVDLRINNVYCNHIACGGLTPDDESATPIDWTDVKYRGLFYHRNNAAGGINTRVYTGTLTLHGPSDVVFVGGSALRSIGHKWVSEYFEQFRAYKDFEQFQGSRQLVVKMGAQFGDGTTPTYVDFSQGSVETPTAETQYWRGTTDSIELAFVGGADDTFDWRAGVFRANTPQKWTLVSDAGASWLHAAASWIGPWDWDNQADVDFTNATWSGGRTVKLGAANHSLLTISGTAATGSGSAAASADGNGSLSSSTLDGTGAEYALELGTLVTAYSLANVSITAGSVGKVHVLATTGTVTITISGTTTLASGDVASAGAMVDISAPSPTLDAVVLANTRAVLWNRTTAAELDNTWITGTSWSKTITSGASSGDVLDLYAFREGYLESVATIIYSGVDATFALEQAVDPAIDYYRTTESITDYTTLSEFNFYAPDIYIQSDDADGATSLKRLFIYYNGALTTEDGARYMRGGITFRSAFDVVINRSVVPVAVDNVSATLGLYFTDEATIRVTTDDGSSWIAPPSAPGSIRYAFGVSPGQIETGVSGLTGPESAQLMALPSALTTANACGTRAVDGAKTQDEILRLMASVVGGKVSGAGTGTETFRGVNDDKDRIVATVDSSGNRNLIILDLT